MSSSGIAMNHESPIHIKPSLQDATNFESAPISSSRYGGLSATRMATAVPNNLGGKHLTKSELDNNPVWARLLLVSDKLDDIKSHFELNKDILTIGRSASADIKIDSSGHPRMISRQHAIIMREKKNDQGYVYKLIDNKSMNGTFVNNIRINTTELKNGDLLMFAGGSKISIGSSFVQLKHKFPTSSLTAMDMDTSNTNASEVCITTTTITAAAPGTHQNINEYERMKFEQELIEKVQGIIYRFEEIYKIDAQATLSMKELPPSLPVDRLNNAEVRNTVLNDNRKRRRSISDVIDSSDVKDVIQIKKEDYNHHHDQDINGQNVNKLIEEEEEDPSFIHDGMHGGNECMSMIKEEDSEPDSKKIRLLQEKLMQEELEKMKQKIKELENANRDLQSNCDTYRQDLDTYRKKVHIQAIDSADSAEVEQELICAICQELILQCITLQCSHNFCKCCITQWLKENKICPVCRKKCSQKPIRNISMDSLMDKFLKKLDSEEKQSRDLKIQELHKKEESALGHLKNLIENAKFKGIRFLCIKDPWNNDEKKLFQQGIQKYDGKARQLYCELTGLTTAFVKSASSSQIMRSCQNLGIHPVRKESSSYANRGLLVDYELTREILLDFIDSDL